MKIHPTAIVDTKAKLADDVEVGPYAIIGPHAEIKKASKIASHAVIDGYTTIGENCPIFTLAFLRTHPPLPQY